MIQDPIKAILEAEKEGEEKLEELKKKIPIEIEKSSKKLEEDLKEAENIIVKECEDNIDNLKKEAKKAYMVEFEKYSKKAEEISSVDLDNEASNIVSDFLTKVAV